MRNYAIRLSAEGAEVVKAQFDQLGARGQAAMQGVARSSQDASGSIRLFGASIPTYQIQNASFQIGDLATQLQGGTRASTALAQQLPQLLGGFGTLGALIGTGVAIGIPLVTAALGDMGAEAESVSDRLDELARANARAKEAIDLQTSSVETLIERYGRADAQIRSLVAGLAQVALDEAVGQARDLQDVFDVYTDQREILPGLAEGAVTLAREFSISADAARALQDAIVGFADASSVTGMTAALRDILVQIEGSRDASGQLTDEMAALNSSVLNVLDGLEQTRGATEEAAGAAGLLADQYARAAAALGQFEDARTRSARGVDLTAADYRARAADLGATEDGRSYFERGISLTGRERAAADASILGRSRSSGGGGGGGVSEIERAAREADREAERILDRVQRGIDRMDEEYERMELDRVAEVNRYVAESFGDLFSGAITGARSLRESLADLAGQLGQLALNQAFMSLFGGVGQSGFGTVLSSLFGIGMRANGGGVTAGQPYWVGERGRELFVPSQSGAVVPAGAGGGGSREMAINVNVAGARGNSEIAAMVQEGVRQGLAAYDQALPSRVARISGDPRRR